MWRHVLNSLSSAITEAVPPHVRGGSFTMAAALRGRVVGSGRSQPAASPTVG